MESTKIDDDLMKFFSNVKDDQQVKNALSNVGNGLKDAVGNIFNDLVKSDYDQLEKKFKNGGLYQSIPGLRDALINSK